MIITKSKGLTAEQVRKIKQPYARNKGQPVKFSVAAKEAEAFFAENPDLLKETGELLNESH